MLTNRHLFLFNDLLIYGSVKHKGTLYEYSDHIYVKHLNLKDISFKSCMYKGVGGGGWWVVMVIVLMVLMDIYVASKIGFQLVRSDETKQRDYIMLCRSLEDKQTWVQHVSYHIISYHIIPYHTIPYHTIITPIFYIIYLFICICLMFFYSFLSFLFLHSGAYHC